MNIDLMSVETGGTNWTTISNTPGVKLFNASAEVYVEVRVTKNNSIGFKIIDVHNKIICDFLLEDFMIDFEPEIIPMIEWLISIEDSLIVDPCEVASHLSLFWPSFMKSKVSNKN
jgi:hypothetical protein